MPNKVALLVHACDRYKFLFKGFELFFSRNWDEGIECNKYFATEEISVEVPGFMNIRSGKGEWAERLAFLLREKVKEDYVLFFQEDMWLNKKVSKDFFNPLFQLAIAKKWGQVKLHSSEVYITKSTADFIAGFNVTELDNAKSKFLMSHQITLWKKDFLLAQLKKSEHPWRNERHGTKRLKKLDPVIQHIDYFGENGKPAINKNESAAIRSEYFTVSQNACLNQNAKRFIDILIASDNVHEKEYGKELLDHFEKELTHDGLERPRHIEFYKKFVNWIFQRNIFT